VKATRASADRTKGNRTKVDRAGKRKPRIKTDPMLLEQIDAATRRRKSIDAVFTLRLPRRKVVESGGIEKLARKVLDRVAAAAGVTYGDVNVFSNLGAFAISAEPAFLRALIREPEIVAATASRRGKGMLIRPRRKRPVRP
jgi:hypothetical protein